MLALHDKIHDVSKSVFTWFEKEHKFINERYFFDFKVIKEVSSYHFHYFLISSDKCVNKYFWRNFRFSSYIWSFSESFFSDRQRFPFVYKFSSFCCYKENFIITCCFECQKSVAKDFNGQISCFIRYFFWGNLNQSKTLP